MQFRIITIDELLSLLQNYNHRELHVHHTWKPRHSNFTGTNGFNLQDAMRNHHVYKNGWDDIAQHVTLLPDGTFVTGRAFSSQPASIKGYNGSNGSYPFMVEMLGNFDIGHDKLEGAQKESMLRLAKFFDNRGKYIRFHRENAPKTCPGSGIDKAKFMAEVKAFVYPPPQPKEEPKVNIGKCTLSIDGRKLEGVIIDGVSYAPIRKLAEEIGLDVGWDANTKTVTLSRKECGCCERI